MDRAGQVVESQLPMTSATVCQILHSLNVGGAEVLATRLARQLRESFRFLFVCLDDLGTLGRELIQDGFPVHVLGRNRGVDWKCSRRLADLLRRERVDLVHAHQYTPFFYGVTARLLCRRPPVLFTEHGRWHPDYPRRKRMVANRILLEHRDQVVGVGEAVRQALIRNEGIPAGRVEVIYNGVDLSRFQTNAQDRALIRQELCLDADDLMILQVARLDALKDHASAIRSLGRVIQQRHNVRLVLVGEGPEEVPIRDLVKQLGLERQVQLLGLRTDVARLLAASDVALLTSVSEGIPLFLIEAMAAKRPVVSTSVGGVGEIVEEESTGLLAPAGDDKKLAEHILRLAQDPALRHRFGRLGRARAEALFSESQMHARYLELYDAMLQG
jgi:glycosyltransferase involved in cell wall biosynthesis